MHPLIAFLTFIFSPSGDWTLKNGFTLVINPHEVPAVVESYKGMIKKYPSSTKKNPELGKSVDDTSMALWAEILLNQGYPDRAYQVWRKALKNDNLEADLSDDIKLRMGEIALRDGRDDKAMEFFEEVAENAGARSIDAKINLLIADLSKEDVETAKSRAQEIVADLGEDRNIKRAYFPLGLLAYAEKDYRQSITYLSHLEDDPRAGYFIGLAHRHHNRPQQALNQWQQIAKAHPNTKWAELSQFQVSETYFSLGDENLSRIASETALALNPSDEIRNKFVFRLASMDVNDGLYEKALERLAEIPENDNLMNRAMVLAAESMVKTGQSSELFKRLAKNKKKDRTVESTFQTAWASLFDKRYERALEVSETGLQDFYHEQYTPRLLLLQGLAYEHQGQTAEALATYQLIADRFHNTTAAAKAIHWSTLAYMRLGRTREAVTHTAHLWNRQSPETKALHPDTAFWLAEAHLQLKRYKDADESYQDFLSLTPMDNTLIANAQFQRSVTLAKMGQTNEALSMLDEFAHTANRTENEALVQMAHLQKGHILFNAKDYENAVAQYRASDRNPKSLYYEGLALHRMDYFNDAVNVWTELAQNHAENQFAEKGLFKAGRTQFELGLSSQAVTTFAKFMESYPSSPLYKDALLQSAHAHYNANKFDLAAPLYAKYLTNYRDTIDLVSVTPFLASSYVQMGKQATEIETLLAGLPRDESIAALNWEQGAKKYNEKNYDEAAEIFGYLLAGYPTSENSPEAMFYRGESYFSKQDWFSAQTTYNNYLTSFPRERLESGPLAMFRRSVSMYNQNKLYDAALSFEEMVNEYPEDKLVNDAKQNLVLCYYNLGHWDIMDQMSTKYNIAHPNASAETTPEENQTPLENSESTTDTVDKRRIYETPGFDVMIKERNPSEIAKNQAESNVQ